MNELEIYPFWQMKNHQRVIVRFLPDLNEENDFKFIDEYSYHRVELKGKTFSALCSDVHESGITPCYHCKKAYKEYKRHRQNEGLKYWRKKHYVGNVIIVDDPLGLRGVNDPEKTYKLLFSQGLYNDIKDSIHSGKIAEWPSDYTNGHNFEIRREQHGMYAKYLGRFRRKSKLTKEQVKLADESLIDLSTLRPKLFTSNCGDDLSKDLMWEILGNV